MDIVGTFNTKRFCDEILNTVAVPHVDAHTLSDRPMFMRDGATPHIVTITDNFIHQQAIEVVDTCPSSNPDQKPIECLWDNTIGLLHSPNNTFQNVAELSTD